MAIDKKHLSDELKNIGNSITADNMPRFSTSLSDIYKKVEDDKNTFDIQLRSLLLEKLSGVVNLMNDNNPKIKRENQLIKIRNNIKIIINLLR